MISSRASSNQPDEPEPKKKKKRKRKYSNPFLIKRQEKRKKKKASWATFSASNLQRDKNRNLHPKTQKKKK